MPASHGQKVRFGPFDFDPHSEELSKGELKLKLQGQPIQVLNLLLERPGELVTREEIRQRLWSADTFVDFEHSLNTAVRKLRQALGDEADTPQYIETLPKRGYRFIGEISRDVPHAGSETFSLPSKSTEPDSTSVLPDSLPLAATIKPALQVESSSARRPRLKLVTVAILATVAVLALLWGLRSFRTTRTPEILVTPLTAYPGGEWEPDLSPDGKMVAFAWDEGNRWGTTAVYVKMVSGDENAVRIAPPGSDCPAWSPDGNSVAFVYGAGPQPGIYVASPLGGTMKMLLGRSLPDPTRATVVAAPAHCHLSWSSDGQSLLFTGPESTTQSSRAIYRLTIRDQKVTQITHPAHTIWGDFYPHFSPDDRTIAFARWTSVDVGEVYVVPSSGGEPRQLTHHNAAIRGLTWTADGKELLIASGRVASGRGAGSVLWRVRLSDGVASQLPLRTFNSWQPTISRRGSRLAFVTGEWGSDIWEVPLKNDGPERKVYSSTLNDLIGSYSPDGAKVAFASYRSGNGALWVANRDGSGLVELASETGLGSPQWSPDGRMIAYDAEPTANGSLFVVSANGGAVIQLSDGQAKDIVPTWSRDSRWIYFSSNRTGVWQIFRVAAQGGQATQVTRDGGLFAQESFDGSRLYFLKPEEKATLDRNGPGIWTKSLVTGVETIVKGTERVQTRFFAVSRSGIYFVQYVNLRWVVNLLDLRTGRIQTIRMLDHHQLGSPNVAVSPDERTLLYTSMDTDADLMLVEKFR